MVVCCVLGGGATLIFTHMYIHMAWTIFGVHNFDFFLGGGDGKGQIYEYILANEEIVNIFLVITELD